MSLVFFETKLYFYLVVFVFPPQVLFLVNLSTAIEFLLFLFYEPLFILTLHY